MHICTLLQTDNHASTPPLSFLQAGCPSCRPTNSVKALKATYIYIHTYKFILHQNRENESEALAQDDWMVKTRPHNWSIKTKNHFKVSHMTTNAQNVTQGWKFPQQPLCVLDITPRIFFLLFQDHYTMSWLLNNSRPGDVSNSQHGLDGQLNCQCLFMLLARLSHCD